MTDGSGAEVAVAEEEARVVSGVQPPVDFAGHPKPLSQQVPSPQVTKLAPQSVLQRGMSPLCIQAAPIEIC